jgi:VWFA-related protein
MTKVSQLKLAGCLEAIANRGTGCDACSTGHHSLQHSAGQNWARRHGLLAPMRSFVLAAVLLCCPAFAMRCLAAEEPRQLPPLATDLEERVEVRLVQLRIFALDKEGRPVIDLRPEEVRIQDGGRTYEAAFLDPMKDREDPGAHIRLQLLAPGGPKGPAEARDGAPRSWILFLDREHELREDRDPLIARLESFVDDNFGAADRVAVISYAREVRIETPFTTDRQAVKEAIRYSYDRMTRSRFLNREQQIRLLMTQVRACGWNPYCLGFGMESHAAEARLQAENWLDALEGVLRFSSGTTGRKVVLVVSQGWALDPSREIAGAGGDPAGSDIGDPRLETLTELAIQLDVALHFISAPVDPYRAGPVSVTSTARLHAALGASQRQANAERWWMAEPTGGRVFEAEDPAVGLAEAVALERSGYTLGYYVDDPARPNRSRRIRLECTRPGVELVGPRAYFPEVRPRKTIGGRLQLISADPISTDDGEVLKVGFQVLVDPEDLGYRRAKADVQTNFGVEVTVYSEGGLPLARVHHFLRHAIDRKTWRAGELEVLPIEGWLELSEGSYELRAIVTNPRDQSEGRFSRELRVGYRDQPILRNDFSEE